jgi:sec-independent protein translocase protein TatC
MGLSYMKEMHLMNHLEELRWHVIRSLSAVLVFTIGAFIIAPWVFEHIIFAPSRVSFPTFRVLCGLGQAIGSEDSFCIKDIPFKLQNRTMSGQLAMHIMASFIIGFILAFPYVIWELYRFIQPGLYKHERKYSRGAVSAISTLFVSGILFAYFVLCPIMISFFATYQISGAIVNEFDISSYVSTIVGLLLGTGLLFQLPMIILFLTNMGIVTPGSLKKKRKHAIVTILVTGAIVTPTADPLSQALIAIPLYVLYEASIIISEKAEKRRQKDAAKNAALETDMVVSNASSN